METQSQNCDDTLNVGKLKEWLRYTSVICLVGAEAPEMAKSLAAIFHKKYIHQLSAPEDLLTLEPSRSKIVVCDDVSLIRRDCALMWFSFNAFRKVIEDNKSIPINGRGSYSSFSLECSRILLYGEAKTAENSAAVIENNGHEVRNPAVADMIIFSAGVRCEDDLNNWIRLRSQMNPNALLMHVSVFADVISDRNATLSTFQVRSKNYLFTNLIFFGDQLQQSLVDSIKKEGGQVTGSLDEAYFVVGEMDDEKLILRMHLKENCALVSEEGILTTLRLGNLDHLLESIIALPQMPIFCNVQNFECLSLFPDPALCASDTEEFVNLSKALGFTIAKSIDECHGVIVPAVSKENEDEHGISPENPPRRTIMCLQEMKDKGPHTKCPVSHFPHFVGEKLEHLKPFNIFGIRAEEVTKFFVKRVLEGVGLELTGKLEKKGKDLIFVDATAVKEKGETLLTLKNNGVNLVKTDLVLDQIAELEILSPDNYYVNCDEMPENLSTKPTLGKKKQTVHENEAQHDEVPKKKIRLDWDAADEMAWVMKTRDLFGGFVTQLLRYSPLQLDIGRVYIKQLINYPAHDSPVSICLTFKADHLKTNTGVVQDFSKLLTQSCHSPIVGGVFYDYTLDLVDAWGRKLFEFLAKMYQEMGVSNVFCREITGNQRGKDLFIILGEEQIDLCCFRTLDNQTDDAVTSCQFTASKFWIPERITDIFMSKSRMPFCLTSPHLMICCGEDCSCKQEPLDTHGKLVSFTCHQPENAPKLARKGVLAYLIRTGDLAGTFKYERNDVGVQVEEENIENFIDKLLALVKEQKCDSIIGDGKVGCDKCLGRQEGFMNVLKIGGVPLICFKCKQECSSGVLTFENST